MLNSLINFLSQLDWVFILQGVIAFTIALILKSLLDLKIAYVLVKYMSFLPVRSIFRENPPIIKGTWEIKWEHGGSEKFSSDTDRHGHTTINQLSNYIYFEFYSQQIKYGFFGSIKSNYISGDWFDLKDKNGYFGTFQLEIVNQNELKGLWLGYSKSTREIRSDAIRCNKLQD